MWLSSIRFQYTIVYTLVGQCFVGGPFLIGAGNYCLRRSTTSQPQKYAEEPGEQHDDGGIQPLDINPNKDREQPNQLNAVTATIQSKRNEGNCDIESVRLDVTEKGTVKEDNEKIRFFVDIPLYQGGSTSVADDDDPIQDPNSGFYIYCKVDGTKLFLCADSKDESKVCLATSVPYPNAYAQFYLEFPSTHRLAPASRWAKDSLHVLRKTAYMRRRQYLVIDTQTRQLSFTPRKALLQNERAICQFTLENMPINRDNVKESGIDVCCKHSKVVGH